jgi:branched-chain amino acid transport system ATP-binding protein
VIETIDVRVQFGGVVAVDDLSLRFDGKICGLIGPNGAGKTTLLNVLSGFVALTAGRLLINGKDYGGRTPAARARAGIRRTFQTDLVVDELTVWDNTLIAAEHIRTPTPAAAVDHILDVVGLHEVRHERVAGLDTFGRRLVEVARAAVGRPSHLLMDEPGGGLGSHESVQLGELITTLAGELDAQIILVDHDVELIAATCDQTACLDFGVLIASGPTQDVLASSEVRKAYLGSLDDEALV